MSRHARAVDANQSEVVAMFRALGCDVRSTASVGAGFPDLAVGLGGRTYLVEVKDGAKSASRRKLTPLELKHRASWKGGWYLVASKEDALRLARQWRAEVDASAAFAELHNRHTDACLEALTDPGATCVCRPPAVAEPMFTPNVRKPR